MLFEFLGFRVYCLYYFFFLFLFFLENEVLVAYYSLKG